MTLQIYSNNTNDNEALWLVKNERDFSKET